MNLRVIVTEGSTRVKWEQMWSHGPSVWSGSNNNKNDGVAVLIKNPHVLVKGRTIIENVDVHF